MVGRDWIYQEKMLLWEKRLRVDLVYVKKKKKKIFYEEKCERGLKIACLVMFPMRIERERWKR